MNDQDNAIIQPADFSRAEAVEKRSLLTINPVSLTIAAVFLLLALAALYMFNARAVSLVFDPALEHAAEVRISGSLPTYRLGERYLMLSGDYDIAASHPGYEHLNETITVGDEPEQQFSFTLTKLPGILSINTTDASGTASGIVEGAQVFVDQELAGTTPLVIDEVPAGIRDIYINHPRYQPYQTEIEIEGKRQQQTVDASLQPAWAMVSVTTIPSGASILIDEEAFAETPATIEVLEGQHVLKLKLPGYKHWEQELVVAAGEDQAVPEVILVKSDGKLNITSDPAGVNVTISGKYYGQTPLSVALPPGERYELLATRAGYQQVSRTFRIEPEADSSLKLTMKPVVGVVRLTVEPPGATLFVNDRELGDPNQTLELSARNHDIRVELPGYASYETSVIPQPGFPQQLNIVLQTEEAARVSAIPQRITTSLGDTLRFIIPGEMTMGAGRREPGRRSNEIEKQVELTRAFYLGEYEISNKSFKAFSPGHDSGLLGRALLSEDDRPVVNVSWDQAAQFCNWLSEKEGLPPAYENVDGQWRLKKPVTTGYRLPTEAEWAWAARYAGSTPPGRFPWGDNMPPPPGAGNFADESAGSMVPYSIRGYNDKFRGPAPSGSFAPNELGIFDLAGNVSEWINDFYSIELHREKLTDPLGAESGEYHVVRGSNYTHGRFSELRWTFRDYGAGPRPDIGFRLARYLE